MENYFIQIMSTIQDLGIKNKEIIELNRIFRVKDKKEGYGQHFYL